MSRSIPFSRVSHGDTLPARTFAASTSAIVAAAIATNDYEPVHHDVAAARDAGMAGVFMNILSTNGIVQAYVRRWSGAGVMTRRIALRLGVPLVAGDTLDLDGQVTWHDATGVAIVTVVGRNGGNVHVTAELELVAA